MTAFRRTAHSRQSSAHLHRIACLLRSALCSCCMVHGHSMLCAAWCARPVEREPAHACRPQRAGTVSKADCAATAGGQAGGRKRGTGVLTAGGRAGWRKGPGQSWTERGGARPARHVGRPEMQSEVRLVRRRRCRSPTTETLSHEAKLRTRSDGGTKRSTLCNPGSNIKCHCIVEAWACRTGSGSSRRCRVQ
jgi:hypothetical protein